MSVFISISIILVLVVAAIKYYVNKKNPKTDRVKMVNSKYSNISIRESIINKKVCQGMTREQLIDSWGVPDRTTKTVLETKMKETLHYGSSKYGSSVYLENGQVVGWRTPK